MLDLNDFALREQPEDNLMVAISWARAWYNGSYTMAAKPIKSLKWHYTDYTMIQFLIIGIIIYDFEYFTSCFDKTLSTKLQKLQNRAARFLLRASYDTNSDSLIDKLGWRKLDKQRLINKATMVYKSLNGLAHNYLRSKFTYRSNVSSYSLRGTNDNLTIPLPHTNFMKNSFSYSGSVLWNSLPIELRQVNSLDAFRAGCKQHF